MWDCPSLGSSLPSAIAYGGCIVLGVELSFSAPFLAPSDVQHGVYQLLIGDDLDTLRDPHAPVALKALALADIVLIVFPPEKVAKAGVIGIKLIRGILDIARVPVDDGVIRAATDLVEKGGQAAAHCAACFPAGTLVATPGGGARPIQTLQVGDSVLSEDPATGRVEAEPVQAVIADPVSPLVAVRLSDGSAITATADHPFWVEVGVPAAHRGAWVEAGQLRPGLRVRTASGSDLLVTGVRRHVGYAPVYTLTVATDHTFFVGQARVLVHNADCPVIAWIRLEDLPSTERRAVEEALERLTGQRPPLTGKLGRHWGIEFQNKEFHLPRMPQGYYHEYTVLLPGATNRGILRLVTGAKGEVYYSWTHYGQSGIPPFVRLR